MPAVAWRSPNCARLLFVALLSICVAGCCTRPRQASPEPSPDQPAPPGVSLQLSATGRAGHEVAVLRLVNSTERPIIVDRELVFLVTLSFYDAAGKPVDMQMQSEVPAPNASELGKRFVEVPPGGTIKREIDLRWPMKEFVFAHGVGPGVAAVSRYEGLYALSRKPRPSRMEASYGASFFGGPVDVALYGGMDRDALDNVFNKRLKASVALPPAK